ncbi:hypothetical protein JKF63_03655 [Porcisia hertigi]|uniref:Mannose-1-phosphate guanyltransferase C-terminal domain-containing protein n=1 Tax=Porcisia hertigi TaxID=2761500 RepID=A0A836ILP0_9TRYP|nr:hypothetical protein JKF63_03655 [Porcisia hertigi]
MDTTAVRRGVVDRGDRQGAKLIAVIIGEVLLPAHQHRGHATVVGPLSPLSPSPRLPAALLPVCNTPVIDYLLENLVANGVDEATILLNSSSTPRTVAHLSECRTERGKPWMLSDSIHVTVVECARRISTLADAVDEIRERNVVPQHGSFLLVPIDTVSSFTNLRAHYHTHLERVRKVGKYAATLLCVSSRPALAAALRNSLVNHLAEAEEVGIQSPTGGGGCHGVLSIQQTSDMLRLRSYSAPVLPRERHTMFVLNKATQVVTYMARFESGEEAPEPPAVVFNSSAPQSVRMDLMPTGYVFCCCEALSLIEFHIRDLYSFLSTSLLGQVEIYGNVFGLIELPSSSAVVEPINSPEAYIQCNLDVCARRLFPMTRESCFAEELAKYAVSSTCETVYLHTTAKCASSSLTGPNVVVGEEVTVPSSVELAGTILGSRVELGDEASLRSCVVMEGARIGRRCVLQGCLIGPHAVIGDGVELSHVIVGEHCILDGVTAGGVPLVVQHEAIECDVESIVNSDGHAISRGDEGEGGPSTSAPSSSSGSRGRAVDHRTDTLLTGVNGRGHALGGRYVSNLLPTVALFTEDPVARQTQSDDDDNSSEEDDEQGLFRRSIQRHVQVALLQPSRIESSSYDMSTLCLSSGFGYPELCEIVTELLVEHLLSTHRDKSPADMVEAAREMFCTWCRPFYNNFLSKNQQPNVDAMVATLEGLCGAIGGENCPLRCYGPQLVEILYYGCEDDLYNERGYCIVSGESLIAFDAEMEHRRQVLQRYTGFNGGQKRKSGAARVSSSDSDTTSTSSSSSGDDESRDLHEEGKVLVAVSCHGFIMGVKDFLDAE